MLQNFTFKTTISDIDQKFLDYFDMEVTQNNISHVSDNEVIPVPEQGFFMGMYSVLLVIGGVGNVAVFVSLLRSRRRKSRVNLLMTHLVIADMMVTFIIIPLEMGWRWTNVWLAGNFACKFFLVMRAFGIYLSSNVLICISLDRFFAVLYPLRLPVARKRSKTMLWVAWIAALLCSLPQSFVFRVKPHPNVPDFIQCVSFGAFSSQNHELVYNVFCLCALYFFPLLVITVCYACIFCEISKNSMEISDKYPEGDHTRIHLRRSDQRPLARARRRTLRMTVTIVSVFGLCWLPYAIMTLWYMLDRETAKLVSPKLQDFFFIMAVSNSCMDPLVYGSYVIDLRKVLMRNIRKVLCLDNSQSEIPGTCGHETFKTKSPNKPVTSPAQTRRKQRGRRFNVRFEETSLGPGPSVGSDPTPCQSDRSVEAEIQFLKPSRSCECFMMNNTRNIKSYTGV